MNKNQVVLSLIILALVIVAVIYNQKVTPENAKIKLTDPKSNQIVSSPLTVTGEARGTWYFEASFPVRLLDENGQELAVMPAQAQGEWMTENFVPFSVTLAFPTPATATGKLILQKDNPSGDPARDEQIEIPVRFR
ncbi:MAG: Gmad2 immunoglobulin-like domain-containing protein [Patescibacteria group bacterium]